MECCSFFSINVVYISDPLHDANISSIYLFGVEEWSTGGVWSVSQEHRLDVVPLSLLVALDSFHALYWCSVAEFEQVQHTLHI